MSVSRGANDFRNPAIISGTQNLHFSKRVTAPSELELDADQKQSMDLIQKYNKFLEQMHSTGQPAAHASAAQRPTANQALVADPTVAADLTGVVLLQPEQKAMQTPLQNVVMENARYNQTVALAKGLSY